MKKSLRSGVVGILILFLAALSHTYANDVDHGRSIMPKQMLEYSSEHEVAELPYSIDYSKSTTGQLGLNGNTKNDYTGNVEGSGTPFLNSTKHDILDPLVGNISFYINNDKNSATLDFLALHKELPGSVSEVTQVGMAFMTNLMIHEVGHAAVADHAGAQENRLDFFSKQGDQFFLGTSTVTNIDDRSRLSYTMGGEFFADLTFEHALKGYRENPTMYNKSLMFFSGTDFLWYCIYAFYIAEEHSSFDPITISKETGLSHDALFSVILAKTAMNAYRIHSGEDRVVPYFTVDKYSASLNVGIPFKSLWIEQAKLFKGHDYSTSAARLSE